MWIKQIGINSGRLKTLVIWKLPLTEGWRWDRVGGEGVGGEEASHEEVRENKMRTRNK